MPQMIIMQEDTTTKQPVGWVVWPASAITSTIAGRSSLKAVAVRLVTVRLV